MHADSIADRPAVHVERLVKTFPRRRAVHEILRRPLHRPARVEALRGVSLSIPTGDLVGLLGPNGAGKTTLLKVLCGLMLPEDGHAEVLGVPVGSSRLPSVLGLVHGDERSFYWRLTARENLAFFARLYGLSGSRRGQRVGQLLERVRLDADADRRFSDFSSGMKQRLAIARALLADPPVLLMDEPTRSLDPVSAAELRSWIRQELHAEGGKTIVLATHNLREAETLCDRVAVLAQGKLLAVATPEEMRRMGVTGVLYRFRIRGAPPQHSAAAKVTESRTAADGTLELQVQMQSDEDLDAWLSELRSSGARVLHCCPEEPDLEQVFHGLVSESLAETGTAQ